MIKLFLSLAEKHGLGVANLALLGFVSWKFATNHFKHLTDQVNKMEKTLTDVDETVGKLGERVAKIEGKIE